MTQAAHGWWCNSRTYPMTCKYCGDRVFYFSCDCGSKLFFDELGQPWPIHRCLELAPKPTLSRLGQEDLSGSLLSYIDDDVATAMSRLIEDNLDRKYVHAITRAAKNEENRSKQSTRIERQDPYNDCRTKERGIITELIRNANIRKKAGVSDTALGVAMLGRFAYSPLVQITIHTMALAEDESENCSFTFFVEESVVDNLQLIKGCLVVAELRGIVISPRYPVWVCDRLTDMY